MQLTLVNRGGEFFTPQEVSELLIRLSIIDNTNIKTVYDPTCGSGSLLLKTIKVLGNEKSKDIKYYGQDINPTTFNLCRMNMLLHHIGYENFDIRRGDTLKEPLHNEFKPFDIIVSNPPYSIQWEGDKNPILINDERYSDCGVLAPSSKADFAFIQHSLNHLKSSGKAAIVCFPSIFHRDGKEQKIRKWLVDNNYVDLIVSLPSNLFFRTSIATNILVLSKSKKDTNVMFINATNEFVKATNQNILSEDNISKIVDTYKNKQELEKFSRIVSYDEIKENDYDLSLSKYIDIQEEEVPINIIELNKEIKEITLKTNSLRNDIDDIIKEIGDE